MTRGVVAVIVGYAVWSVLWLVGGFLLGLGFPDAAEAWRSGGAISSGGYLIGALILSVGCSVAAGRTNLALRNGNARPLWIMAALLLATGIAVQVSSWARMPVWFHLPFLALIVPVVVMAGKSGTTKNTR